MADPRKPPQGAELLTLYQAVLGEYRFQVQLNWDRAKHYLVFNAAVFGAAAGLLKLGTFEGRTGSSRLSSRWGR